MKNILLWFDEHVKPAWNALRYAVQGNRDAARKAWDYVWRRK
jgi:hypothetical protein